MGNEIYGFDGRLITSDTDFKREMKPSAILNYFQEVAGINAESLGIGYTSLHPRGLFWVLSKIYVEMSEPLFYGDAIRVDTWPHTPNKAIFERSFSVKSEGAVKIRALSRWCLLDSATGRIAPASKATYNEANLIDERAVEFDDWRIPLLEEKKDPAFSIKIAHSEYDLNYHVNNIRYADYVFNCFSIEELTARRVKSFQINYVKQSHVHDVLEFYRKETADGEYIVEGVKNGAETVVSARVCFE